MSVIWQEGKSQNGCFKKTKHAKISEKTNISYLLIRTRNKWERNQGVRNVRFAENLACFVFLKRPSSDSPFCFITNESYLQSSPPVEIKYRSSYVNWTCVTWAECPMYFLPFVWNKLIEFQWFSIVTNCPIRAAFLEVPLKILDFLNNFEFNYEFSYF